MKFNEIILAYSLYIYVSAGMFLTWIVQMRLGKKAKKDWKDRAIESFICSFFTASVSLPLLEHFPDLPHSISLLIGGFVGCIGFTGWQSVSASVINIFTTRFGGSPIEIKREESVDNVSIRKKSTVKTNGRKYAQGEPPMPQERSDFNETTRFK